jgi:hypothetical protein
MTAVATPPRGGRREGGRLAVLTWIWNFVFQVDARVCARWCWTQPVPGAGPGFFVSTVQR